MRRADDRRACQKSLTAAGGFTSSRRDL
jgi:hypothetical protein